MRNLACKFENSLDTGNETQNQLKYLQDLEREEVRSPSDRRIVLLWVGGRNSRCSWKSGGEEKQLGSLSHGQRGGSSRGSDRSSQSPQPPVVPYSCQVPHRYLRLKRVRHQNLSDKSPKLATGRELGIKVPFCPLDESPTSWWFRVPIHITFDLKIIAAYKKTQVTSNPADY